MKKNTLVQLIVIYVGIMAMYAGINSLISNLAFFIAGFYGPNYRQSYVSGYLVAYILMLVVGFVVVTKSGGISEFITEKSGLDDSLKIYTKPNQLLSILIVVLSLSHLLEYVPVFLHDLFLMLTGGLPRRSFAATNDGPPPSKWFVNILHLLLPCLMIIFCRPLTQYFSKNIVLDENDIIAEHDTVTIDSTGSAEQV